MATHFDPSHEEQPHDDRKTDEKNRRSSPAPVGRQCVNALRHSYATGLLEAGVDLLTISRLLGHASFATTMVYLHCRREHMLSTPSPLDWLPVDQLPTYRPPAESPKPQSQPEAKTDSQPESQPPPETPH